MNTAGLGDKADRGGKSQITDSETRQRRRKPWLYTPIHPKPETS